MTTTRREARMQRALATIRDLAQARKLKPRKVEQIVNEALSAPILGVEHGPTHNRDMPQTMYLEEWGVAAWSPADDPADHAPTQVHLHCKLAEDLPEFAIRLKSAKAVNYMIDLLARYRREVWGA